MADSVISLSRVLVEEYESQMGGSPPLREELAKRQEVLEAEYAALRDGDPEEYARQVDAGLVKAFYSWLHGNGVRRSALCLSGGGIRSATFGLGLVQGLSRQGLLKGFDYLSTVSGGGYLGGWLSGWIHRERTRLADADRAVEQVESRLSSMPASPLDPEPRPVQHLRTYSRYMSPRLGFLSADTWTLLAIFLRNLLLNWLVLLPLIAAVLMVPRISVILVRLGGREWFREHLDWALPAVFWAAVACGMVAIAYFGANRPSLREHSRFPERWRGQGWFLVLCLLPLSLMAVLSTVYWAWVLRSGIPLDRLRFEILGLEFLPWIAFALFGMLLHAGGALLSRIWVRRFRWGELLVVLLTGGLGGALAWLFASRLFTDLEAGVNEELYVSLAAPLLLGLFLLVATIFVGIASYYTDDADREWLARAGAWVLIAIFVRAVFSGLVLFGPDLMLRAGALAASSVGGVSGLLTLLLGGSGLTPAGKGPAAKKEKKAAGISNVVLAFAAPLFAVSVFVGLALGTTYLIRWLTEVWILGFDWHLGQPGASWPLLQVVRHSPWMPVAAVLLGLLAVGLVMGFFIDINRFSLHAAYRDRLIRAYLGASRAGQRRPNPFTGFDEDDNFEISDLRARDLPGGDTVRGNRPFHVVNMALNLVGGTGKKLAWQDRKAETFTLSALHAGNLRLGYRDSAAYGRHRPLPGRGKERRRAISLGTSMAISGAAASPNMGYHSSPVVTFLLALFNVRLGWWLGNPGRAGETTYTKPGPLFAPRPLFEEAFGLTDDDKPYVYLSDGGHFENLGLYEMVVRRCRFIVVSDGGQDPDFSFEDLGNAVSKIRVDLGVPILFDKIPMRPHAAAGEERKAAYDATPGVPPTPYCAIGRICYSCVDQAPGAEVEDGLLLYVKPSLNGTEPTDVFHYARLHPLFPHEPTSDQLYSETQFESYRELGSHAMAAILDGLPAGSTLADLFEKLEKDLGKAPKCRPEGRAERSGRGRPGY